MPLDKYAQAIRLFNNIKDALEPSPHLRQIF